MHMSKLFHTLLYINCPLCIPFPLYSTLYILFVYALKYASALYIIIIQQTRHALFIVDSTAFVVNIPIEI